MRLGCVMLTPPNEEDSFIVNNSYAVSTATQILERFTPGTAVGGGNPVVHAYVIIAGVIYYQVTNDDSVTAFSHMVYNEMQLV